MESAKVEEPSRASLLAAPEKPAKVKTSPLAMKTGGELSKVDKMFGITDEHKHKWNDWLVNNSAKLLLVLLVVAANIAVIAERLHHYLSGDGKKYTDVVGWGIPIARASAAAIKLDSGLILICVLRNFLSWVRSTWVGSYLPIDDNIKFHKYLGWVLATLSSIHVLAHGVNFYKIGFEADANDLAEIGMLARGKEPATPWESLTTLPGATGVVITLVMFFMFTTSVASTRRPMFEVFWFTHHLFLVYFIVNSFHGAAGLLETPTFWCWTIGPLVMYLIERTIRIIRGSQKTIVVKAIQHPAKTIEIRLKKASFKYKSGQYVFLQCPYIAAFEWHPFTISSSPDADYMSVHIRIVGDWTGDLYNLLNPTKKPSGVIQKNMINAPDGQPIFLVDGPFGTASADVWKFEHVQLWAAGIGVTPFASILKSIRHQMKEGTCKIKTVEFYWTNRECVAFEWFLDLLDDLAHTCPGLEIYLFFTGNIGADQVKRAMAAPAKEGGKATFSSFLSRTTFARPNIPHIFETRAKEFQGRTVGVFFCGPPAVSSQLLKACQKNTSGSTKFVYHKENF
eukprot:TRINITY_DN3968_c0_g1_i1.p1 TRINITY_DN3968_c0_g1~~TRINITY_DN3968_c0_g1_i1.p1  ORF type:complete len:566 (-),score=129.27 TRINITY_DN3968_c0_g1_i1:52-1749(-)